jgi:hypothetical protein
MKKLEKFIEDDYAYFSNLSNSEVEEYNISSFDSDVVEHLKSAKHNRFDYDGICVYLVEDRSEIWVENMNS